MIKTSVPLLLVMLSKSRGYQNFGFGYPNSQFMSPTYNSQPAYFNSIPTNYYNSANSRPNSAYQSLLNNPTIPSNTNFFTNVQFHDQVVSPRDVQQVANIESLSGKFTVGNNNAAPLRVNIESLKGKFSDYIRTYPNLPWGSKAQAQQGTGWPGFDKVVSIQQGTGWPGFDKIVPIQQSTGWPSFGNVVPINYDITKTTSIVRPDPRVTASTTTTTVTSSSEPQKNNHDEDEHFEIDERHKYGSCYPPSGGSGNCVVIQNCPPLYQLLTKPNKTPADIDMLRRSGCGFERKTPKVCCPASAPATSNRCLTPHWEEGKCVGLNSCPHIAAMLNPPLSNENMQFIQRSACQGSEQNSVCCGSGLTPPKGNCPSRLTAFPPDPRTQCCGVDSKAGNKIFGGSATAIDQYNWLTLIEYVQGRATKLLCGGALISARYVLSAAHCVTGEVLQIGTPTNVRLGEYDTKNRGRDCVPAEGGLEAEDCADPVVTIPIERTIAHSQYNTKTKKHDIALIRLAEPAPFTDFIRPICLPTIDVTANVPPTGLQFYVAGWGRVNNMTRGSNIKIHVDLPYVRLDQCEKNHERKTGRKMSLGQGQLCAGGVKNKDTCNGDSGGPLMYENGMTWEMVGIVSVGPPACGSENRPGIYTKTIEYINWIHANITP